MSTIDLLPAGYTVRAPELADAEGIFALTAAYNTAVTGSADCNLGDIADCLVEPGFDRATDGFLAVAVDGRPIGYATTCGKGDLAVIEIEVTAPDPEVAARLYELAMRRALEMGRAGGHAEITVDSCVNQADGPLRTLLAGHDFTVGTTYHRMRIDHTGPVAGPQIPADVVIRRGLSDDDASRWIAHEVLIDCFRGQFGFVPRPHDEWVAFHQASSIMPWSQFTLLEVNGRVVAIRICGENFLESENCGYVGMLGVVAAFRGRGLAKFLLRDAFARDAADGRAGTILHVDTNNPTPALGLYLSVGMRPTLSFDGWRRTFQVG